MVNVEDLPQKKLHFTPLTCTSQASSLCDSSVQLYNPTWRRTHPPFSEAAQQSPILDIFEGISTDACCETTLVLAAPQTEPLHRRYLVLQPQYQHPQTPCSCLCLTTKWISPLCRRKWAEKQRPVLVYYPQLKKLPFSKRKILSLQTPLSRIHPPKGHSDLLAHFKKMTAHQCFLGILHKLGNRGAEGHTPLPWGSHRTIQRLHCWCRGFSVTIKSRNFSLPSQCVHGRKLQEKI